MNSRQNKEGVPRRLDITALNTRFETTAMATQAQIDANRKNAQKSTGPRSAKGKADARRNSLKHGMTGNGVVIPYEDAAEVAIRVEQFEAELSPDGHATTSVLAMRAAMLTVRLERCIRYDDATTADRVRFAGDDFDEARLANADFLFDHIAQAPVTRYRELLAMPEGVDRILVALRGLQRCATAGSGDAWTDMHGYDLDMYCGLRPSDLPESRCRLLTRAVTTGQFDILPPAADAPEGDYHAHYRWALDQILTIINDQIAHLEAHRQTIDTAKIMQSRAEAGLRALVSMSPDAVLFRRYEAASERALNRTLQQIRDLQQDRDRNQNETAQAVEAMAANSRAMPEMAEYEAPLGSFRPGTNQQPTRPFPSAGSDPKPTNRQARRARQAQERRQATE